MTLTGAASLGPTIKALAEQRDYWKKRTLIAEGKIRANSCALCGSFNGHMNNCTSRK